MGLWINTCIASAVVVPLLVMTISLISVSIFNIDNNSYGLVYNKVSRSFDQNQTPLEQGRYALQPGDTVFYFPRIFVLQNFTNLPCVTNDGLMLYLDVSVQYRLRQENLVQMYQTFGDIYQDVIDLQCQTGILSACGNWNGTDFFYNRQVVQQVRTSNYNVSNVFRIWKIEQMRNLGKFTAMEVCYSSLTSSLIKIFRALYLRFKQANRNVFIFIILIKM
jgi:hypothetical protein